MTWIMLAEIIMKLVGPKLGELINKWLEKLLRTEATRMDVERMAGLMDGPMEGGQNGEHVEDLLNAVLGRIPRGRVLRRALVRTMMEVVPPAVADKAKKLPTADAKELAGLAARINSDEAK